MISHAQPISVQIQSQRFENHSTVTPSLLIPLSNPKYQLVSFIQLNKQDQKFSYENKAYGLGLNYQVAPWLFSQVSLSDQSHAKTQLKLGIDF